MCKWYAFSSVYSPNLHWAEMDNRGHKGARELNYRADTISLPTRSFDPVALSLRLFGGFHPYQLSNRSLQLQRCIWLARCTSLDPHRAGLRYNDAEIIKLHTTSNHDSYVRWKYIWPSISIAVFSIPQLSYTIHYAHISLGRNRKNLLATLRRSKNNLSV